MSGLINKVCEVISNCRGRAEKDLSVSDCLIDSSCEMFCNETMNWHIKCAITSIYKWITMLLYWFSKHQMNACTVTGVLLIIHCVSSINEIQHYMSE